MNIELIKPSLSKNEVLSLLGEPKKISFSKNNFEIFSYENPDTALDHFVYFENEKVVLISRDIYGSKFSVQGLSGEQNLSQAEVYELEIPSRINPQKNYLFLWPSRGFGLIANENSTDSTVSKTFVFSPMSKDEFFMIWTQSSLVTQQVGFIQNDKNSEQLIQPVEKQSRFSEKQIIFGGAVLIVITLLLFSALAFTMKKRGKKKALPVLEKK